MPTHRIIRPVRVTSAIVLLAVGGCRHAATPDAYGNFEATETVVSAADAGALLWFTPTEGQQVATGARCSA